MEKTYKKTVLKNGLRIITVPQPGNLATTVLVLVSTGSKYETKEISGVAHFLEHLCFKGTKNRPSARAIAEELDGLGASYNAFTGHEYTGYYAKVENHKGPQALDIVSDLYLNPLFNKDEMETEKGVVIEELAMYEDMPQRKIYDQFMHLLYGDQPAGWDIGGSKKIIQAITRDQVINFRSQNYLPQSTTLIIAGGFNQDNVLNQASKLFADMPQNEKASKQAVKEDQTTPAVSIKFKESDQTHVRMGFRTFNMFDSRRYALKIIADVLGGGMSSRLFHRIREQLGAAYYVGAEDDLYTDHGYIAASVGAEHSKLDKVIEVILEEFSRLKTETIDEEELARAKSHLSGSMLLGLETSNSLAVFYGIQEILREEVSTPRDLQDRLEAVSASDIQNLAQEILTPKNLNLALIGPQKDSNHFQELVNAFK